MALASINSSPQEEIASISVPARVDYIFRFSRQVALVLGDTSDAYLDVSHSCLNALSVDRNTAYIQLSSKLNDIQVRCRIVEQLFAQQLFDPEKPLVETIQGLIGHGIKNNKGQKISIVVEHGQHLSPQLLFELTQVNELGKRKDSVCVNILIVADNQAKSLVAANLATFSSRIAVLNAYDGQIVPISSTDSRRLLTGKTNNLWQPLLWVLLGVCLLVAITLAVLHSTGSLATFLPDLSKNGQVVTSQAITKPGVIETTEVAIEQRVVVSNSLAQAKQQVPNIASHQDIFLALTQAQRFEDKVIAEPDDILASLSLNGANVLPLATVKVDKSQASTEKVQIQPPVPPKEAEQVLTQTPVQSPNHVIDNSYFADKTGYVIQFSAFSSKSVLEQYLVIHRQRQPFIGYQRLNEGRIWYVLTSPVFQSREAAHAALARLPEDFVKAGAWIKSTAAVKQEIAF